MKIIILVLLLVSLDVFAKNEFGSIDRPIILAMVPGQDAIVLSKNGEIVQKFLEQDTGLFFKIVVPQNYITVVESFGTNRVDMSMLNAFGYILANEKYGAKARLMGMFKNRSVYWGQIIARNDGPKSLKEIDGKTFAFVDPASTSGHLLAAKALKEENVKPKNTIFAGKHDSVVLMVYQGRVDAGATYHILEDNGVPQDARDLVKTQYPDVFQKVVILKKTGPIPNDPIVFSKDFPKEIENKVVQSLKKFAKTDAGKKALYNLYHMDDLKDATDADWNAVRDMLKSLNKNASEFIKK